MPEKYCLKMTGQRDIEFKIMRYEIMRQEYIIWISVPH